MHLNQTAEIGYISKVQGLKGELKIKLTFFNLEFTQIPTFVLFKKNEILIPQEVEGFKILGEDLILKIKASNHVDEAKNWIGYLVNIDKKLIVSNPLTELANTIVDYTVIDANHGAIGNVKMLDIESLQPILYINKNDKEILIPFVMVDIITNINHELKQIDVHTPNGLLEIYL